jgi:hypothetical protein
MSDVPTESEAEWRRLQELLLGHLWGAGLPVWPSLLWGSLPTLMRCVSLAVRRFGAPMPAPRLAAGRFMMRLRYELMGYGTLP